MTTYIRGFCERSEAAAGSPITFVASTSALARDGMVIKQDGWRLDNYRASPVVLWSHDYAGARPPIGRADNLRIDDGNLRADIVFDQGDPFAREVERKYRDGFLNAVSVGWDTLEFEPDTERGGGNVLSAELLDISAVNVPGDPGALIQRQIRALQEITQATEPEASASVSWHETAVEMAALFHPTAQRPDDTERKRTYQRLARAYAKAGKVAPEFLTAWVVNALDADDVRALFLEGEPELIPEVFAAMEVRTGAVLSTRNHDDLRQAVTLITGVLDRAAKPDPEPEPDETEQRTAAAIDRLYARLVET